MNICVLMRLVARHELHDAMNAREEVDMIDSISVYLITKLFS